MKYQELFNHLTEIARCAHILRASGNPVIKSDPRVLPEKVQVDITPYRKLGEVLSKLNDLPEYLASRRSDGWERAWVALQDLSKTITDIEVGLGVTESAKPVAPQTGMQYNDVIDALLEIARCADQLMADAQVANSSYVQGTLVIGQDQYQALGDAMAALEALPQTPGKKSRESASAAYRAAEFIKTFRGESGFGKPGHKGRDAEYIGLRQQLETSERLRRELVDSANADLLSQNSRVHELQEKLTEANLTLQAAGFKWQPRLQCWQAPTQHDMVVRAARAERALRAAGFEDRGGAEWVPPLGEPPRAHPLEHRVRDLETRLNGLMEWKETFMRVNAPEVDHPGGIRPAAPRPAPPPAKQPCADCGGAFHKYSECPPFSVPPAPIPADVALQETPKRSLGAEVNNADKNDQVDHGLRQRMFDKLAEIKVEHGTPHAKFIVKYVGGSDKLVDVPAEKWQTVIAACDEYLQLRGI